AGGRMLLSLLLPITLVVMTTLGAYYPAVDVAAGERERRTVETTLSQPRKPLELVFAKLGTVVLAACLSLVLNLASMFLAARLIAPPEASGLLFTIEPGALVLLLMSGFGFAVLSSATLLAMAFRATSFREAQSTAGAVYGLGIVPALIAVVPGIELTPALALVPVANVAMVIKALFRGSLDAGSYALFAVSTVLLACLMVALCARSVGDPERWLKMAKTRRSNPTSPERRRP
ncbi:hypothetical protein JW921_10975, partial [Candidatus Fermentibacterales bacterium]|nr:hypothetical protein [Candidatus Fermentibacterales bacterium]